MNNVQQDHRIQVTLDFSFCERCHMVEPDIDSPCSPKWSDRWETTDGKPICKICRLNHD